MSSIQLGLIILFLTFALINEYHLLSMIIIFIYVFYCLFKRFKNRLCFFLLSILIIILRYNAVISEEVPQTSIIGYVHTIENYGYIVRSFKSNQKYLIYTDDIVGINDIVRIEGEPHKITSLRNFDVFNYEKYMHNLHTNYYYSNPTITSIYQSKIAGNFSRHILRSNNELLKSYLYGNNDLVSYESIFFSTGMHFSFLFSLCLQLLGFYFYEKDSKQIVRIIKIVFFVLFPYTFSIMRILLMDILMSTKISRTNRTLIYIVFFCIIDPFYVSSYAFFIPLLFYVTSYFRNTTSKQVYNVVILIPIYSAMNSSLSLVTIILFNMLRKIYNCFFIVSLICLLLPICNTFIYNIYLKFQALLLLVEKYDIVLIIGKMNIVYFIIYYIIVLLKNGNFRFIYASIMILINYLFVSINIFPEITILDVGQGDSIMVEYPFNKATILIDTGGNLYRDIASEVTIPYLHSKGKKAIDMVFLSHDDFDHSGAFELLSKQAIVREVISEAHENTVFRIDSNNYINLYYIGDYEDENENSLIMCLNFDDLKFFTAGDITKEIENRILRHNLIGKVDLMKLSHHGSATSNSKEFLNYLRPKFAINSSGVNNFYHHPSIEVVNNLEELGIPYLDTQKVGAIQIKFIGEIVLIRTMNNEIYAIM